MNNENMISSEDGMIKTLKEIVDNSSQVAITFHSLAEFEQRNNATTNVYFTESDAKRAIDNHKGKSAELIHQFSDDFFIVATYH